VTSCVMSKACASERDTFSCIIPVHFFLYFASNCITFFISCSFLRRTQRVLYFTYISRVLLQIAMRASGRASQQPCPRVLSVRFGVSVHLVCLAVLEDDQLPWFHLLFLLLRDFHRVSFVGQHERSVHGGHFQLSPVFPRHRELNRVLLDLQDATGRFHQTIHVDGFDRAVTRRRRHSVQVTRANFFAIWCVQHPLLFVRFRKR